MKVHFDHPVTVRNSACVREGVFKHHIQEDVSRNLELFVISEIGTT